MDWVCEHIKSKEARDNGIYTNDTHSGNSTGSTFSHDDIEWDLERITSWIIIPSVCSLGLLGNLMAFLVFLYRLQVGWGDNFDFQKLHPIPCTLYSGLKNIFSNGYTF